MWFGRIMFFVYAFELMISDVNLATRQLTTEIRPSISVESFIKKLAFNSQAYIVSEVQPTNFSSFPDSGFFR